MPTKTFSIHDAVNQLKINFGFDTFRPHQATLVEGLLSGMDVFGIMPTGGGKSLCYQLPAVMLEGTAIIVSPLIALMKDQVDAARANGIRAELLNSTLSPELAQEVEEKYRNGNLDLLYMAPERLSQASTLELLRSNSIGAPSFIAIDEAHCISEWGHDFRPDYLITSRLKSLFPGSPLAAFTATATKQVAKDIEKSLDLQQPIKIRASFDRANLFYDVQPKRSIDKQIVEFIRERPKQSGIIYRTSRKSVDETARMLVANGLNAGAYHAGLDPQKRSETQEAFIRDDLTIIVATIAFGMGVDKADVRYVIHADLPKTLENYYQETGRAGRDGEASHCLLLYSAGDLGKLRFFLEQITDTEEKQRSEKLLMAMNRFASTPSCRKKTLLAYFDESLESDNCGACDYCTGSYTEIDATTEAQMILSAIMRTGNRFGSIHICDIVTGANTAKIRQLEHDRLKTYGVGKNKDKAYWRNLTDSLLAQHFLVLSEGQYPVPQISDQGMELLFGRATFSHAMDQRIKPQKHNSTRDDIVCDHDFLNYLKDIRKDIADCSNIPPYVVFSDRSLKAMAAYQPSNNEDFLAIPGVGENKLEKYGARFLAEIQGYITHNPHVTELKSIPPLQEPRNIKKGVSETLKTTQDMIKQGLSLDEIASQRQLSLSTIETHAAKLIQENVDIPWQQYINHSQIELGRELFNEHGFSALKPIVEASEDQLSYGQARIIAALIQQQQST